MPLINDDFEARLEKAPNPKDVIDELFSKARSISEGRFFCSIVDFEITYEGKNFFRRELRRHWVVQQFAEYFSRIRISIEDIPQKEDANFVRRLQMLAYSQFWECLAIQRLISQLVNIASGKQYEPRLYLDNHPNTYELYKEIRNNAEGQKLSLASFITAAYSNQIRNAFVHSEFWILDEFIFFQNHNNTKDYSIPLLKLETWDILFNKTSEFIIALFEARKDTEAELSKLAPYETSLSEFMRPLVFKKDKRGYWSV